MTLKSITDLGPSCPSGGRFYVCQSSKTRFMGCCTIDPCKDGSGSCPRGNLTLTSFSSDSFEDIPQQNCSSSNGVKEWYTCKNNKPPFMGCCSKNPCSSGTCATTDLIAARLSDNSTNAAVFLSTTASSSSSSTSATAAPTTGSSATNPTHESSQSSGLHPGAIAGIVIGGLIALSLILLLLFWKMGWRLRNTERESRIIAEFPATYIPNALPDMGPAHSYGGGGGGGGGSKDFADSSYRNSLGSTTVASTQPPTPAATVIHDQRPFATPRVSILSGTGSDSHGHYSRVSPMPDESPEPSPRFEPIAEVNSHEAAPEATRAADEQNRQQQTSPQQQRYYHSLSERPFSELPGSEPPPEAQQPGPKWKPYRPS